MRLIDADAFILKLREASKKCEYTKTTIDKNLTVDDVFEAIISELDGTSLNGFNFAPTVSQWIPCSERLPEEDDYRPCYGYEDGAVWWRNDMGLMGLGWYYSSTGRWAYYDESDKCDKCIGNVVEWMPLPEAFKGVTDGNHN